MKDSGGTPIVGARTQLTNSGGGLSAGGAPLHLRSSRAGCRPLTPPSDGRSGGTTGGETPTAVEKGGAARRALTTRRGGPPRGVPRHRPVVPEVGTLKVTETIWRIPCRRFTLCGTRTLHSSGVSPGRTRRSMRLRLRPRGSLLGVGGSCLRSQESLEARRRAAPLVHPRLAARGARTRRVAGVSEHETVGRVGCTSTVAGLVRAGEMAGPGRATDPPVTATTARPTPPGSSRGNGDGWSGRSTNRRKPKALRPPRRPLPARVPAGTRPVRVVLTGTGGTICGPAPRGPRLVSRRLGPLESKRWRLGGALQDSLPSGHPAPPHALPGSGGLIAGPPRATRRWPRKSCRRSSPRSGRVRSSGSRGRSGSVCGWLGKRAEPVRARPALLTLRATGAVPPLLCPRRGTGRGGGLGPRRWGGVRAPRGSTSPARPLPFLWPSAGRCGL